MRHITIPLPLLVIILFVLSNSLLHAQGSMFGEKSDYNVTTLDSAIQDFEMPDYSILSKGSTSLSGVDFVDVFTKFVKEDPTNPDAHYYLGKAYITKMRSSTQLWGLLKMPGSIVDRMKYADSVSSCFLSAIRASEKRPMKHGSIHFATDNYRRGMLQLALSRLMVDDIGGYKQRLMYTKTAVDFNDAQLQFARRILTSCDSNAILFTGASQPDNNQPDISVVIYYVHSIEGVRSDISLIHRPLINEPEYFTICTTGVRNLFPPVKALPLVENPEKLTLGILCEYDSIVIPTFALSLETRKKLKHIYNVNIRYIPDSISTADSYASMFSLNGNDYGKRLFWGDKLERPIYIMPDHSQLWMSSYNTYGYSRFEGFADRMTPLTKSTFNDYKEDGNTSFEDSVSLASMTTPDTNRLLAIINSTEDEKMFTGDPTGLTVNTGYFQIARKYLNEAYGDSAGADASILERILRVYFQAPKTTDPEIIKDRIDLVSAINRRKNANPKTKEMVRTITASYKTVLRDNCLKGGRRFLKDPLDNYLEVLYLLGECDEAQSFVDMLSRKEYLALKGKDDKSIRLYTVSIVSGAEKVFYRSDCGARYDMRAILYSTDMPLENQRFSLNSDRAYGPHNTIFVLVLQQKPQVGDTITLKWYDMRTSTMVANQTALWSADDLESSKKSTLGEYSKLMAFNEDGNIPEGIYRGDILINNRVLQEVKCAIVADK